MASSAKYNQLNDYARNPKTWMDDARRHLAVAELLNHCGNEPGRTFYERSGCFYSSYFHASVAVETAHKAVRVLRDPSLIQNGGLRPNAFRGTGHKLIGPVTEILGSVTAREKELLEKLEAFGEVGRYSVLKNADLLLDERRMDLLRNAGLNEFAEIRSIVERLGGMVDTAASAA